MKLRIEDGILLRPYALAWKPEGWSPPPAGWTPDDTCKWVKEKAAELAEDFKRNNDGQEVPSVFTLKVAAQNHGDHLHKNRAPWFGWVPVDAMKDRDISKAYRKRFSEINPQVSDVTVELARKKATWPEDGWYEFVNGKMSLVEDDAAS